MTTDSRYSMTVLDRDGAASFDLDQPPVRVGHGWDDVERATVNFELDVKARCANLTVCREGYPDGPQINLRFSLEALEGLRKAISQACGDLSDK